MSLSKRALADSQFVPCDECGRDWPDVGSPAAPDTRPFVRLRGTLGHCRVNTVLCPECQDEAISTLWNSEEERIERIREWDDDKVRAALFALSVGRGDNVRDIPTASLPNTGTGVGR